ncbi:MAG: hypothetical protein V4689_21240 [Verrucomicrobiota bacterium]
MKTLIPVALLLALQIPALCGESPVTTTPVTEASLTISPKESAYPGKQWITRQFRIENTSGRKFYVSGYSPDHVFVQIHTKDPESGKWVRRIAGFCATGASKILIPQDSAFTVTVNLPVEISDREFTIEFTRTFGFGSQAAGETTTSEPLSMKSKP